MENKKAPAAKKKNEFLEWVKSLAIAVFVALMVRAFLFEFVVVKQTSMYPTLEPEQKLGLFKCAYLFSEPKHDDVVVIKIDNEKDYVKRVIAVAGQTVEIKDSRVYINSVELEEPYLVEGLVYSDYGPCSVPEGYIFVMGDNRPSSIDSRVLGLISTSRLKGKVIFRVYPFRFF
ncbi:MAG: signal peptidase I [Eubacteriaceae bacterium]|nr:signal peptidase I [Eubacteriaceae bacterium]